MSRIGKKPIALPKGVTVKIDGNVVAVQETKGKLDTMIPRGIKVEQQDPSCCSTLIPRGIVVSSLPFVSCTATTFPSILTVTPLGNAIGFFPIRDIRISS